MKAEKIIIIQTTVNVDLDIKEITLLSIEEYRATQEYIPAINKWWWLRSPGFSPYLAAFVHSDGSVGSCGCIVDLVSGAVRPALRISNLRAANLKQGDKIFVANRKWTVVSEELVVVDKPIGNSPFRQDYGADNANVYEASDVKKYVENWAKENGIEIKEV